MMNKTDEMIAKVKPGDMTAANDLARYIESLEAQIDEIRDILNLTPDREIVPVIREKMMLYSIMMQVTQIEHEKEKANRWKDNPLFNPNLKRKQS